MRGFQEAVDSIMGDMREIKRLSDDIMEGELKMQPQTLDQINNPSPTAQLDISILMGSRCITDSTVDVYAEHDTGDESTGDPGGWIVNSVMLGQADITNEVDLVEIQIYLKETLSQQLS